MCAGLGQYGQAWYVNGDVAPDLYLVRGQKYTFIVEVSWWQGEFWFNCCVQGGLGTDQDGTIHPFYLTSDNEGGYGTKSDYEAKVKYRVMYSHNYYRLIIIDLSLLDILC